MQCTSGDPSETTLALGTGVLYLRPLLYAGKVKDVHAKIDHSSLLITAHARLADAAKCTLL